MILLDVTARLTPKDSKTNLTFPFRVPEGGGVLQIHFAYAPKELADADAARALIADGFARYAPSPYGDRYGEWKAYLPVVNLVTLSLDGPDGYRGCAHRHAPIQEHVLSASHTSPGFIPRPPVAGLWRAQINCHAVVTPYCQMRLRVEATEGGCAP